MAASDWPRLSLECMFYTLMSIFFTADVIYRAFAFISKEYSKKYLQLPAFLLNFHKIENDNFHEMGQDHSICTLKIMFVTTGGQTGEFS